MQANFYLNGAQVHRVLDETNVHGYLVAPSYYYRFMFLPIKHMLAMIAQNLLPFDHGLRLEKPVTGGNKQLVARPSIATLSGFELFESLPAGFLWRGRVYAFDFAGRFVVHFKDDLKVNQVSEMSYEKIPLKHFIECNITTGVPKRKAATKVLLLGGQDVTAKLGAPQISLIAVVALMFVGTLLYKCWALRNTDDDEQDKTQPGKDKEQTITSTTK